MSKRDYSPKLRGKRLEEYGRVMARERASLLVSAERQRWILATYPPDETGRPDIMCQENAQPSSVGRDIEGGLERIEEADGAVYWRPKEGKDGP